MSTSPESKRMMQFALAGAVLFGIAFWVYSSQSHADEGEEIPFSEFLEELEARKIVEVEIRGVEIRGKRGDVESGVVSEAPEDAFVTYAPTITKELVDEIRTQKVKLHAEPEDGGGLWEEIAASWLPLLLIFGLFFYFMRRSQSGGGGGPGGVMAFGKMKGTEQDASESTVRFTDVAGVEEAKVELQEVVAFLRDPEKFTRLGGRIPKGVLLIGPPGTGKTLLAKAVAGEAGVPFFALSGSDFVEMFVGVGASRVRDLFEQARERAPAIIFIDEIDAVGRHRGAGLGGGHDEREQTLNQLLVEMDGFAEDSGVIIMAATNRIDILDPALMRPGRFDRRVTVPPPDLAGRLEILKIHGRGVRISSDVDFEVQARGTIGFTGADLENLVNEAALCAARRDVDEVEAVDFETARDKVTLGSARNHAVISARDREICAIHEAGHAVVALMSSDDGEPVHKVSIVPHGMSFGVTQTFPTEDMLCITADRLLAKIRQTLAGRAAEELVFNHRSTQAADDLMNATRWAKEMVCRYGMSEQLGPVTLGQEPQGDLFLGRDMGSRRTYSGAKAEEIDDEIARLLNQIYDEALAVLREHRDLLDRISEALLERETLTSVDLEELKRAS